MNIFSESNYRQILREVVEERKSIDGKFNFQSIGESTRIPKSYISKVTTEKAHFNCDQLCAICEYLGFNEIQIRYMMLLLELERCTQKKRQDILTHDVGAIRDKALDSTEHIKAKADKLSEQCLRDYYIDPMNQIVHICLSIPRYQKEPQRLAADLRLSPTELRLIIERLEALSIIEHSNGKIRTILKSIHLPKSSPAYKPWRNQLKLLCMDRLNRDVRTDDYSFSVTFSATPKTRNKIKSEFLSLLKQVEETVQGADLEETYQMSFDLFSWTEKKL
jgi:uncharacterized protein (TIGR02147 family)